MNSNQLKMLVNYIITTYKYDTSIFSLRLMIHYSYSVTTRCEAKFVDQYLVSIGSLSLRFLLTFVNIRPSNNYNLCIS